MKPAVPIAMMVLLGLPAVPAVSAQDDVPPLVPPVEEKEKKKEKEKEKKPTEQPAGLDALDLAPVEEDGSGDSGEAAGQVPEDPREPVALFDLTADEANADTIDMINAELHMVLDRSERHRVVSLEDAAENMMMSPAESLRFCNEEPGCIADLGKDLGAQRLLYGSVKDSFDKNLVLVHLALVDVPGRKLAAEKFGQFSKKKNVNVVVETGNLLRDLIGIQRPAPEKKPPPKAVAIKLPPATAPPKTPPPAPVTTVETGQRGPWHNPWTWTAAGVGLASLAAGTVLGIMSHQKQEDAQAPGYDQPTAYGMVQDAEDLALGANLLFGLGGAALATAAVLFILDATGDAPAVSTSVACSGEGCTAVFSTAF